MAMIQLPIEMRRLGVFHRRVVCITSRSAAQSNWPVTRSVVDRLDGPRGRRGGRARAAGGVSRGGSCLQSLSSTGMQRSLSRSAAPSQGAPPRCWLGPPGSVTLLLLLVRLACARPPHGPSHSRRPTTHTQRHLPSGAPPGRAQRSARSARSEHGLGGRRRDDRREERRGGHPLLRSGFLFDPFGRHPSGNARIGSGRSSHDVGERPHPLKRLVPPHPGTRASTRAGRPITSGNARIHSGGSSHHVGKRAHPLGRLVPSRRETRASTRAARTITYWHASPEVARGLPEPVVRLSRGSTRVAGAGGTPLPR